MRTAFIASFLALASLVAAAPVAIVDDSAIAVAEPVFETQELAVEESTEPLHSLDKRAATCSKASQCKQGIPANAQRTCASKKCSWSCKSGYNKSGSKCVKKPAPKPAPKPAAKAPAKAVAKPANLATTSYFSGKGTWFTQNGVAGSCGKKNSDSTLLVAMNSPQVSGGKHCGRYVTLTNTANGKSVRALVADECPGCAYGSLDLSTAAFKAISNLDAGVIPIKWTWS
ncbi:hypothetical protein JCM10449v2_000243 [Rhodotorula kratochvilovae]